jgi:hypothetical protein
LTALTLPGNNGLDRCFPQHRRAIRSLLLFQRIWSRPELLDAARLHRPIEELEGRMSADLQFLEEWIPERMDPGTVFVLENQAKLGHAQNPFVAVMSCPRCGTLGLITRRQLCAGETMICGGEICSAEYRLDGENIRFRRVQ